MNTFQALVMAVESRLSMATQTGSSHIAYTCETLIDIAKHFDDRLAALERAAQTVRIDMPPMSDDQINAVMAGRKMELRDTGPDLAAIKAAARDDELDAVRQNAWDSGRISGLEEAAM